MALDYIALGMLVFVVLVIFYGVIAIHDIPYEIAKRRNHPQQDAIHVAGWISLFTLHTLWPFLWIWATLWREDRGWGFTTLKEEQHDINHQVTQLSERIEQLKSDVESLKQQQQQQNDQTMTQEKQEND
ncbi:DUF3302 domain-containing protein [Salinivibrio sp. IB643]|jgi:Protein of unknown function (DUF3302).|uniref:DUF3302 domain-containing protein n=1 Tax=Salinivibrio TaxID=51366 RepID=UPI000988B191|nr:DUF3302 domain-containing protein [Salinivibrio sp. IB643]OOE96915.1 GTPase [Salinivibrio sp. IB643]